MPDSPSVHPELLTAQEVSDRLRVALNTVYKWARNGVLEPVRVGRAVRFRASDIDELLAKAAS